ncbi:hypothetical protein PLICRDRAFT_319211 [Plicaturopsis crispa FD-325 SS-3]|nr:hypothetical protein PLICRDRAFT_319211 [Plicaturopsis crispa FD-325 SS-3]
MELKLVYRALRQISEWTVAGYYNEVRVEGAENVPADAPLIIAARHPNEIIDVAAITITIPYRRHLSFWAKSPLFSWAIMRAILLSSGAIPVLRMPNKPTDKESSDPGVRQAASTRQTALFASTSAALDAGAAVAVFPEGTTCTEPGMPLLREGAVWAAVEFVKWADRKRYKGEDVLIIPVGITYTDKMVLKSNVIITYAPSIRITDYYKPGIEESRVVKEVTAELERRLLQVTANARDWDTYHAAQMARDILWDDASRIELDKYVPVMQTLYDLFDPSNATEPQQCAKDALIQYYSLTHHASIPHRALSAIYPSPAPPAVSRGSALLSLLRTGIRTLSPWTLAFIPPFLLHLPAYVLSPLAGRLLPKHREDEAVAQWRAVAGGVGMAVGWGIWGCVGWRRFGLRRIVDRLMLGRGQKAVLLVAATYLAAHIMARWHNALIDCTSGSIPLNPQILTLHDRQLPPVSCLPRSLLAL